MVGRQVLVLLIGVRVPTPEHTRVRLPAGLHATGMQAEILPTQPIYIKKPPLQVIFLFLNLFFLHNPPVKKNTFFSWFG